MFSTVYRRNESEGTEKRRMQLLEEIHKQQELLDQMDYVIFKKEKIGGKAD